jgi:hypothetical protein
MHRNRVLIVAMLMVWGMAGALLAAERKPIEQLPGDVVRWSTTWMEIPKQMAEVSRDEGPVSGLMWGPAKGTALMFRSTTNALWELVKPAQQPVLPGREKASGAILHYEF